MSGWSSFLALVVAGGIGAGLRYLVDGLVMKGRTDAFPVGILLVNVTGSFVLGLVAGLGGALGGEWITVVGVGLLGGYTTFSTVSVESALLAQGPRRPWAWVNLFGTLVICLVAAAIGIAVGGLFPG